MIAAGITNICYIGVDATGKILFDGSAEGGEDYLYNVDEEDVAAGEFAVQLKMPKETVSTTSYFIKVEGTEGEEEATLLGIGIDDVSESTLVDGAFVKSEDCTLTITGVAEGAEVGDKVEDLFAAEGVSIKLGVGDKTLLPTADQLNYTVAPDELYDEEAGTFVKAGEATIVADYCGIATEPIKVAVGTDAYVCVAYTDDTYALLNETVIYDGESISEIPNFSKLVLCTCTVTPGTTGERVYTPIENVEIDTATLKVGDTAKALTDALTTDDNGKALTFGYTEGKELSDAYTLQDCLLKVEAVTETYVCLTEEGQLVLIDNHVFSVSDKLYATDMTLAYKDGDSYKAVDGTTITGFTIDGTGPYQYVVLRESNNNAYLFAVYESVRGYSKSAGATLHVE